MKAWHEAEAEDGKAHATTTTASCTPEMLSKLAFVAEPCQFGTLKNAPALRFTHLEAQALATACPAKGIICWGNNA